MCKEHKLSSSQLAVLLTSHIGTLWLEVGALGFCIPDKSAEPIHSFSHSLKGAYRRFLIHAARVSGREA